MPSNNTVYLHRVIAATPEKLFRAFTTKDALAQWMPPHGFTAHVAHLDAVVGGTFRMSFTNFTTGQDIWFGGEYREILPNEKLVYTDKFDDPHLLGEILVTVQFKAVSCGCELTIAQANLPAVIPLEQCYLGWQQSLNNLAKLVEPEIRQ
jgi:uncharacterized protein YndB with AHSA1/START domain